ncbi:MAG TPA: MBL fold metallo-hydrolase [Leptospiraceae bacterium]|nr:MBL fold metallo-hydrolase [Leptospiraceae bacterium]
MAELSKRLSSNKSGNFFVDSNCIDCGACQYLAPEIYREAGEFSSVCRQPEAEEEVRDALRALFACPVHSIGFTEKPSFLSEVRNSFPERIEENIFYCGFHSEKSYGAFSYLIFREDGNILVDSPRFTKPLIRNLEKMGGVRYMFLTHQDDVADHEKFHLHFQCERIIHSLDRNGMNAEIILQGSDDSKFSDDILFIPVPGHTRGSVCLLYKDRYLFSGDHLAYSDKRNHLVGFRDACWYSRKELYLSMKKLQSYSFQYVLPGHGKSYRAGTAEEMKEQMELCVRFLSEKF